MKKILLGSVVMMSAFMARADYVVNPDDAFRVGVGGYMRAYWGKMQEVDTNTIFKAEPYLTLAYDVNDDMTLKGKAAYRIIRATRFPKDKVSRWYDAYVMADSKSLGQLYFGNVKNVEYLLHQGPVDVSSIQVEDSDMYFFYSKPSGFYAPMMTQLNSDSRDVKINYISPDFNGLKVGITGVAAEPYDFESCAPSGLKTEHGKGVIAAMQYKTQVYGVNVGSSIGFAYYNDDKIALSSGDYYSNHNEYSVGVKLEKNDFSWGASFREMLYEDKLNIKNTTAFATGIAYDIPEYGASLNYFTSQSHYTTRNTYTHLMLSGRYQIIPYVNLTLSTGHVRFDMQDDSDKKGWFGLTSIEFKL